MSDDRGRSDMALAFAFIAGALVGAGIALLLAPKSGVETREQVADWARRAQERAREAASKLRDASRHDG
jgi:gas vesicle protein